MDVRAVRAAMQRVVAKVRAGHGPWFIEATTYRFMGHSMADPAHGHYRTKEEVEEYRQRDPLLVLKNTMMSQNLADEADFKQLEQEIREAVRAAVKFADESLFPAPSDLHADVLQELASHGVVLP